jgi:putative exosortase-associated protein (TIGR04073 family)
MRSFICLFTAAAACFLAAGCAGPERKLGRGINNATEFLRFGEIRRSVEQTSLFGSPDESYTTGLIHGFNRSVARTAVGAYEIVTFPIPRYDHALILPERPVYPDSYKPKMLADPTTNPDYFLGFSGGDVFPWSPGSRFSIFDY